MPRYEYRCQACGIVEKSHSMGEARDTEKCPSCGDAATRVFSAPLLSRVPAPLRSAVDQAERSRDEPTVVRRQESRQGSRQERSAPANPALEKLVGKEAASNVRNAPQRTPHR